jgi:hypothetical protein
MLDINGSADNFPWRGAGRSVFGAWSLVWLVVGSAILSGSAGLRVSWGFQRRPTCSCTVAALQPASSRVFTTCERSGASFPLAEIISFIVALPGGEVLKEHTTVRLNVE